MACISIQCLYRHDSTLFPEASLKMSLGPVTRTASTYRLPAPWSYTLLPQALASFHKVLLDLISWTEWTPWIPCTSLTHILFWGPQSSWGTPHLEVSSGALASSYIFWNGAKSLPRRLHSPPSFCREDIEAQLSPFPAAPSPCSKPAPGHFITSFMLDPYHSTGFFFHS